ncbi:hypothetical protein [Sinomonas atrocyanea]
MTAPAQPSVRAWWASLSWTPLYRVAGVAALLFVLFDLAALALYTVDAPPVSGGEATLRFIAGHKASYIAQQLLWLVPSLFGLVVFAALLVALLPTNPSLALLGFTVGAASWTALLAVPTSSVGSLSLVTLSDAWSAADDAARPAFAAAAEALVAENNTVALAGILTPLGVLLISLPMVRGPLPAGSAGSGSPPGRSASRARCCGSPSPPSMRSTDRSCGCGSPPSASPFWG